MADVQYRAVMIQTASCVVTFEADEDATPEELEAAAYATEFPTLCNQCASSDRNQSLSIDGEWDLVRDDKTGEPEIEKEG